MDIFERVREVNAGTSLTEDRIIGARIRLLQGIDDSRVAERKRLTRRPLFLIAGAMASVAAVTATVAVINQWTAPEPRVEAIPTPTAEPTRQPGETLPRPQPTAAPGMAEPFPGTTPQQGQYLHVETTDDILWYRGPSAALFQWGYRYEDSPPISAALMRSKSELFVPADRTGEWISRQGPWNERLEFYSSDPGPGNQVAWDNMLPYRPEVEEHASAGGVWRGGGDVLFGSLDSYAEYPTDPQALLQHLLDRHLSWGGSQDDADESVVGAIIEELTSNYAPPDVRAAFAEALALSGAEVESAVGNVVTYRLRFTKVSFPTTVTVAIDTSTGWVREYTSRADRSDNAEQDMAPTDVPDIRKTFTVSIVDALP